MAASCTFVPKFGGRGPVDDGSARVVVTDRGPQVLNPDAMDLIEL